MSAYEIFCFGQYVARGAFIINFVAIMLYFLNRASNLLLIKDNMNYI